MKILIVSQYFWPENFKINDIALGLTERGHEVSVLTGLPNYPKGEFYEGYSAESADEVWNGIKVYRVRLHPRKKGGLHLVRNYLSFAYYGWRRAAKLPGGADAVLVYEPSPITVGIPAIRAARKLKAPMYFWVQDLWPESLRDAGNIKNKQVIALFDLVTKYIYKKSYRILVQSQGFKKYILNQGVAAEKIIFYPNSTESFYRKVPAQEEYRQLLPAGFTLMFAGNLGESQGLPVLVEAAELLDKAGIRVNWIILGEGRNRLLLESMIREKGLTNFYLLGAFPPTEMPHFFACADALVSTLKKAEIFSLTIPSKIQSYMACGKPILASLDGEGAQLIREAQCGYASPAEDAAGLASNVEKIYNDSAEQRQIMGENALQYFQKYFEREILLARLEEILKLKAHPDS